jgi:serine/threonine-protein kinase
MAPEQAKGLPLSPKADLYSFGAVLYRTLGGRPPFEGENDQSVLYQHVYEKPKPLNEVNPAVPLSVSRLSQSLLHKDPGPRPSAAAATHTLAEVLRDYREHLSATPRGGLSRSGHYPGGPAEPGRLEIAGSYDLGGEVAWPGELVAWEGRLWVGSGRGVARFDLAEGRVQRFPLADEVSAPPALADGRIYAGAWDGTLSALEPSGRLAWSFPTHAEITAAPLVLGGRIYLAGRDGFLRCIDEKGGLIWAFQAGGHLSASPTLYRGLLFVAAEDGWLYALDPLSGHLRYKVETGPVHASLPAARGIVLIPTWAGEVHAFDPLGREVLWSFELEGEIWGAPALDHRRAYLSSWGGKLIAVDLHSGEECWSYPTGKITAGLSLACGHVFAATEEGRVLALEASSGRLIFEASGLGPVQAPPLPYRTSLYVANLEGRLYRFTENG